MFCEKYEKYFLKNYFQPPSPIIAHTIFLVALPNEMNQTASLAIVRALRNGRGQFRIYFIQNIEIVWGAIVYPRVMCAPTLCKSTPLFNNVLLPSS